MRPRKSLPIYVISLARAPERRARISAQLESFGVQYEIQDAVDGKTLDTESIRHRLDFKNYPKKYRGDSIHIDQIGCYLSHYQVWEKIVAEKTPFALILEDDAQLADDFMKVVGDVLRSPYYWNLVHLGDKGSAMFPRRVTRTLGRVGENRQLSEFAYPVHGTYAYLIDLDGAKKLLKHCFVIREPLDVQWKSYWKFGVYFYHVEPGPVDPDISGPSTIRGGNWLKVEYCRNRKLLKYLGVLVYFRAHLNYFWDRWVCRIYCLMHPPKKRK